MALQPILKWWSRLYNEACQPELVEGGLTQNFIAFDKLRLTVFNLFSSVKNFYETLAKR